MIGDAVTADAATDCDDCHRSIAYGETCWLMPTGRTWDGDDQDKGRLVGEVVCAECREARVARCWL